MKKKTKRRLKVMFAWAGGGAMASLIGSKMPGTIGQTLTTTGTGMGGMTAPIVTATGVAMTIDQLKKLKKLKKKKVRRGYR